MDFAAVFRILGGLGLFLFGMRMMSSGIEVMAGSRMQSILQRATSNRFIGVAVGIVATIAINSSTAVTIMTVSFVNSGLMNLVQSMSIILGANVGTTFSAQLVAFRVDTFAPLFIFIGVILHLFFKKKKVKNIGYIVLGFGTLFFGISVLGGPLRALADEPALRGILAAFQNPFLALLAGFAFTAIVQSSTTTTAILVAMHLEGVPISFEASAFIVLGTNIGTSITTLIASIPANRESKRAALFHIMFDVIGSSVFGTIIVLFPAILTWFQTTWTESARQVAMFHTLYNFATMFLILPFIRPVARLMEKIIPIKVIDTDDSTYERKLVYLDSAIVQSPSVIIPNAHLELSRIHKIANEMLESAVEAFFKNDVNGAKRVAKDKKTLNYITRRISSRLSKTNNMLLSQLDAKRLAKMFRILYNIERIGDHAENVTEYTETIHDKDLKLPKAAKEDLKKLSKATIELSIMSQEAFEAQDASLLEQIKTMESDVDKLCKEITENHVNRIKSESIDPHCAVIFTDIIVDLERSADHAEDIAVSVLTQSNKNKKKVIKKQEKTRKINS
ncbi:MAG: Na/Pi cotransporter family protein [Oscillospiraceae bacterium]|nr:Na/Pi cotransporter family protein [Oscillospiraceae bacterium]MCL2278969.1 Na/Pi cotransporter family protein [Oscillospiraceae bacterium]